MIRLLLIASMSLLACGALSPPRDGGIATGGGGGRTSTGGGVGSTGGGGGGTGGGGGGGGESTGGGGMLTGGGAAGGGFAWVTMSFSSAPTSSQVQSTAGIVRRGNGETWLALADGQVFRAPGGSNQFDRIPGFPAPISNDRYSDVVATTDELFIFNSRKVYRCATPCDSFSDFAELPVTDSGAFDDYEHGCALGDALYVVALTSSSSASLYRLDRTGTPHLVKVASDLGLIDAGRCSFAPNGDVFIPSNGVDGVLHFFATGGSARELFDLHGSTDGFGFREVAISGDDAGVVAVAIGFGNGPSSARRRGTTWFEESVPVGGVMLEGWADLGGGELLAGINANGAAREVPSMVRLTPGGPRALVPAAPVFDVEHGFTVSTDEVYFSGVARQGGGYVVLHGTR